MTTNREVISKVKSLLRLTSSDIFFSDRMILSYLLDTNVKLVTQALNKRQSSNSPNLFTEIPCLEMKPVPLYSCCDTQSDCLIAESVLELPTIVETYYEMAIRYVRSIDRKNEFKRLDNPQRLANLLVIYPNKPLDNFYWVQNNRLYITNPNIEKVALSAFFKGIVDTSKFCCGEGEECFKPLDEEFHTIPKLEDDITRITSELIMNTFKRIPQENSIDGLEGN